MITTCQICARAIKAKRGTIAHHGYTRPGCGWQTASCFGAGWRPYEVACDALPVAIDRINAHVDRTIALIDAPPPAGFEVPPRRSWTSATRCVLRPAGFDPRTATDDHRPDSYAHLFIARRDRLFADVRASKQMVAELRERLAAWKAVA